MAGYEVTIGALNNRVGSNVAQLFGVMADIRKIKSWLDTQTDADLSNLGWSATDIANVRSAYNDMEQLANVFDGEATQTVATDFKTFPQRLVGINQW